MKMYSLFDSKSCQFTHPFGSQNDECAIRLVRNDVNRRDGSLISSNPEDFTLCYVGDFDEHAGWFTKFDKHKEISKAIDLVQMGAE